MAQIEVNHNTLCEVASAIMTYCDAQDREMRAADAEVKSMLTVGWLGPDAQEFGSKWEGVDEKDSATVKLRESLKNFAGALEACAKEYRTAQEDAYNAANGLPKWLYW